jgi:hypothetical protein
VFDSHSPLALKLVEVLNAGIVYALRRANRRLLSLESFA